MGRVQRGGHLGRDPQGGGGRQRTPAVQEVAQVAAGDVAHGDVQDAVGLAASKTGTMCGWSIAAAARDSCVKRRRKVSLRASSGRAVSGRRCVPGAGRGPGRRRPCPRVRSPARSGSPPPAARPARTAARRRGACRRSRALPVTGDDPGGRGRRRGLSGAGGGAPSDASEAGSRGGRRRSGCGRPAAARGSSSPTRRVGSGPWSSRKPARRSPTGPGHRARRCRARAGWARAAGPPPGAVPAPRRRPGVVRHHAGRGVGVFRHHAGRGWASSGTMRVGGWASSGAGPPGRGPWSGTWAPSAADASCGTASSVA